MTNADRVPGLRHRLLLKSDPIARRYGKYTAYQLHIDEFIGKVEHDSSALDLRPFDYEYNPMSAAKYHPDTEELDDHSWRRIDPDNPRWQWHVHTWEDASQAEIFSHYEYRPDLVLIGDESISDMNQRLRDHYRPKWDTSHDADEANYFLGVACPRLRAFVGD